LQSVDQRHGQLELRLLPVGEFETEDACCDKVRPETTRRVSKVCPRPRRDPREAEGTPVKPVRAAGLCPFVGEVLDDSGHSAADEGNPTAPYAWHVSQIPDQWHLAVTVETS
jgi:hypothetical protein